MKRLVKWYKGLTGFKKLLVNFIGNWFYWGLAYLVIHYINAGKEQSLSINEYVVMVTIAAGFWTLLYNVNYKRLLGKNKDQNVQVSDTTNNEKSS